MLQSAVKHVGSRVSQLGFKSWIHHPSHKRSLIFSPLSLLYLSLFICKTEIKKIVSHGVIVRVNCSICKIFRAWHIIYGHISTFILLL